MDGHARLQIDFGRFVSLQEPSFSEDDPCGLQRPGRYLVESPARSDRESGIHAIDEFADSNASLGMALILSGQSSESWSDSHAANPPGAPEPGCVWSSQRTMEPIGRTDESLARISRLDGF